MSTTTSLDPIARLYQACNPNEDLGPEDPRFVNFDNARSGDLIDRLVRSFRRAGETPERKLFAGHRGIGKTSELRRLRAELEKASLPSPAYVTAFIDATRQLDSNDLDFPDLLVLIASEIQQQLSDSKIAGFDPTTIFMKCLWEDFKNLLKSQIELRQTEIDLPFGSLALELRNRPNGRAILREKIEAIATDLMQAVNNLLIEANAAIRKEGKGGLVLIIDGLDKISRRPLDDGSNTHDRLFIDRAPHLSALETHVIYTIPISMYYSCRCATLEQTFGEFNTPVSMIRIRSDNKGPISPDTPGMIKLKEMLERRCSYADVDCIEVFAEPSVLIYLCEMSGGHPRHLLTFLRSSLDRLDKLPITQVAAEKAVRDYANSLLREIPDRFWEKLKQYEEPNDEVYKDEDYQEMLFLLHIFEYMNGRPWYEVNPVIRSLERFHQNTGD